MELREYQKLAIGAAREAYRAGRRAIVLVSPTGSGKTVMGSALGGRVVGKGKTAAWFVHRDELAEQAKTAFERIGVRVGVVAGSTNSDPTAPFQIISIQTAASRSLVPNADMVFIDECHHSLSDVWGATFRELRRRAVPIIGFTATPDRGDGVGLDGVFDHLIPVAQPKELIALGHLVPVTVIGPTRRTKTLAGDPVTAYLSLLSGRQTIVFCSSVAFARKLADRYRSAGVPAECVDGKMTADARHAAIRDFRASRLRILTSVQVLTEGFDAPETSGVILASTCSVPSSLIQKVGRGMRPAPWIGKTDCIVLDLKGSCRELAMLPDDDRVYSLEGKAIRAAEGLTPIRQCPECGHQFHAAQFKDRTCPGCGHQTKGRQDPAVRRAIMSAMAEKMPAEERLRFLADKIREGRNKRKKDGTPYKAVGWAIQQYAAKFRKRGCPAEWPTKEHIRDAHDLIRREDETRDARRAQPPDCLPGVCA
jgi:DNA repair protein RadD